MLWAHSRKDKPPDQWQPLDHHLRNVATRAAGFAESFHSKDWAYIAGLWHDLGKGSLEFQEYLKSQNEACAESLSGRVDHSSARCAACRISNTYFRAYPFLCHCRASCGPVGWACRGRLPGKTTFQSYSPMEMRNGRLADFVWRA